MSGITPWQSRACLGPITDTSRWENFQHRQDDIFKCTYLVVPPDPRDVYCSNLNHRDNMTDEELATPEQAHWLLNGRA